LRGFTRKWIIRPEIGGCAWQSEALASARYRHLLIDLCGLGHADDLGKAGKDGPSLDQPLAELASSALSRAHHRLLKRGHGFETLSKSERHDVRIALKRLRYALDFFGSIFNSEPKKKFVKRLARLQDDLGRMNDVVVAETMLARLVGVASDGSESAVLMAPQRQLAFAAGGILGWHRRRAAEIDLQLVKDWNAFARAQPFWMQEQNAAT
jgi:triphosphatase